MKLLLFSLFITLFLCQTTLSQERPQFKMKFYKRSDGRLFVNKDMPLYLTLGNTPDNTGESHLLESESSPKYSNPFFLDTEGYNTIRTPSKVDPETHKVIWPIEDIIFEVYADGIPPVVKIEYEQSKSSVTDTILILNQTNSIRLGAVDGMSGVENIYYSVDQNPYKIYTGPLQFSEEKIYTIRVFAVDHVGNAGTDEILNFRIDKSSPTTTLSKKDDFFADILSSRTKILLESTDQISGIQLIQYQIDSLPVATYRSIPVLLSSLKEGDHTITYWATDKTGITEAKKSYSFYIDNTPPEIQYEVIGDDFKSEGTTFISDRTRIRLNATDNKAGVKEIYYSLNNQPAILYTEPVKIEEVSRKVNIRFYAVDMVNNSNKKEALLGMQKLNMNVYKDMVAPKLKVNFIGKHAVVNNIIYLKDDTKIDIQAKDATSGVEKISYKINGENRDYNKPFDLNKEGEYNIYYEGTDVVNNKFAADLKVVVDTTAPQIDYKFGITSIKQESANNKMLDVYPSFTTLFINAMDEKVGLETLYYQMNDLPEQKSDGVIPDLRAGTYHIRIRAVDRLGNESMKEIEFIVR